MNADKAAIIARATEVLGPAGAAAAEALVLDRRARAYLDILLGTGSRPTADGASSTDRPGAIPPGFAGKVNLTIPLATLLGLAGRPGEIPGIGPIDPDPGADT